MLNILNLMPTISSCFSIQKQKPLNDQEKIHDEVKRQGSKCTCVKQFRIHKIGEGKYRVMYSVTLYIVFTYRIFSLQCGAVKGTF